MTAIVYKYADSQAEYDEIAKLNYSTFVEEIPQHEPNPERVRVDAMHHKNTYIIAKNSENGLMGMMALNMERPFSLDYKIENLDKYLNPAINYCEVRLLSITPKSRKGLILRGLIGLLADYAVKNKVGCLLVSGTTRELKMYNRVGFKPFHNLVGKEGAYYQPMMLMVTNKEVDKWTL